MKTSTVNLLSIPFFELIGPATVISNMGKVIKDVAKIAVTFFGTLMVKPSKAYEEYKQTGSQEKLTQKDHLKIARDKNLTEAKNDLVQHVKYIGIGLIRCIPLFGAGALSIYDAIQAKKIDAVSEIKES